jgi:hypothetical protein
VPVAYDLGSIDERFNLSPEEARAAISDAESLWEDATGKNLFTYTEGADFTINFIYDDRQERTDQEGKVRSILNTKEEMSEQIRDQYDELLQKYQKLKGTYTARVEDYEDALKAYNNEVELWNEKGGAPPSVYADLEKTKANLDEESKELNQRAEELNGIVDSINQLGEKGNSVVQTYNSDVAWYNALFSGEREFTQGDYEGDRINIYQFRDGTELREVLAHELGHALSLEHVEDEHGIMYYLMEGPGLKLSSADLGEFHRVCGAD